MRRSKKNSSSACLIVLGIISSRLDEWGCNLCHSYKNDRIHRSHVFMLSSSLGTQKIRNTVDVVETTEWVPVIIVINIKRYSACTYAGCCCWILDRGGKIMYAYEASSGHPTRCDLLALPWPIIRKASWKLAFGKFRHNRHISYSIFQAHGKKGSSHPFSSSWMWTALQVIDWRRP